MCQEDGGLGGLFVGFAVYFSVVEEFAEFHLFVCVEGGCFCTKVGHGDLRLVKLIL